VDSVRSRQQRKHSAREAPLKIKSGHFARRAQKPVKWNRDPRPRLLPLAPTNRVHHRLTVMPRLTCSLALAAAVATSVLVLDRSTAAEGQEAHGVYHTQFENEWVRLVRVRYPANSKVPLHGHPPTITTYVYLSESSPVRFTHHGSRTHVVTRQPTTPGAFRVSRGGDETHTAENLGPIASEFLRAELKTDPAGATSPFYRDNRPLGAAASPAADVRFTNAQMRITRVGIPAGQTAEIATTANTPAVLIALGEATITVDGAALALKTGQERWVAAPRRERVANAGATGVELLRIDMLTRPAN
jgi:quercetin dioxygenase-like cupin family protein